MRSKSRGHGLGIDELAADAEAAGPGVQEVGGRVQVHAAGRHEPHLRQRPAHRLEEGRPQHVGGKHFHDVGPRLPRGQDLGRRERTRHDQLIVPLTEANHVEVDGRRDEVLGPGEEGGAGGFGVEDGAGAEQQAVAEGAADLAQHVERVGHGHGDFDDVDSAVGQRPGDLDELLAVRRPHDGDDAAVEHAAQVGFLAHGKKLLGRPVRLLWGGGGTGGQGGAAGRRDWRRPNVGSQPGPMFVRIGGGPFPEASA